MQIEYEAVFPNVGHADMQEKLKNCGAQLVKKKTLMKRVAFNFPKGHELANGWARVRDEGDKITMTLKVTTGNDIKSKREVELVIDDFDTGVRFLETLGCIKKAYQENFREMWTMDDVEIMLDEWPFLAPFAEIEGPSEGSVRLAAKKLGMDYRHAIFGSVDMQYAEKYGITRERVCEKTPQIVFAEPNPFV